MNTAFLLMAQYSGAPKFDGFALTIHAKDEAEADRQFNALLQGGEVTMPLAKTFFAVRFGMLRDKFGVHWMVMVPLPSGRPFGQALSQPAVQN